MNNHPGGLNKTEGESGIESMSKLYLLAKVAMTGEIQQRYIGSIIQREINGRYM